MTVYAVLNQKGGVGKTTLALNLADAWACQGLSVLLVDVDKQAAATCSLVAWEDEGYNTLADVLRGDDGDLATAIYGTDPQWGDEKTPFEVVPAALALEDVWASQSPGLVFRLRRALAKQSGASPRGALLDYDRIILDGPPDLGPGTVSAAVAADHVIVPTRPERMSMHGVSRTVEMVNLIRRDMAPNLNLAAIIPVAVDGRLTEHKARVVELQAAYGDTVTEPIPHRLRSDEASGYAVPGRSLPGSAGEALGSAYRALAVELDRRVAK